MIRDQHPCAGIPANSQKRTQNPWPEGTLQSQERLVYDEHFRLSIDRGGHYLKHGTIRPQASPVVETNKDPGILSASSAEVGDLSLMHPNPPR
jgi:hypothetical protein